ncbi:GroES chaperonin family [uncultured Caudovirales phage]|uniref:GroES chaperonin family n=1 Tax=uncultured Caudovirales phage TaxID=2100421 RepID=A0A6J5P953_9CAUD|nr:GroES chaperonin family [uncultured Caudovirales phage]
MKAIRKQVILQTIEQATTTASGIVIQGESGAQTYARVISIGHEVTEVQPGNQVLVDWRQVRAFKFEGEQYYTVAETMIIAVCEDV